MITRETAEIKGIDFSLGELILIDKPKWKTSFGVISSVRKSAGIKKAGHAGTLDPMATGLLIIATGKRTKELSGFQDMEKTYTGIITLGKTSPSMDTETPVESREITPDITKEKIMALKEQFTGRISQVPPMYSAVKLNGKTLYKLARKGLEVKRESREVVVYDFIITNINLPDIEFEIKCSKGTYIRVIANDLGEKLGCGALLSSLRRTGIGNYSVEQALSPMEFHELLHPSETKILPVS